MPLVFYLFVFLFGLIVGSFLNCVIYRLEQGQSFLKGRSYCPHCRHNLSWPDLIPVLSFLFLLGKCRYCQEKISFQYPLVELSTATIFILIWSTVSNIYTGVYLLLMAGFLIVIFIYDLRHYIIPDRVVYPAIAAVIIYHLIRLLGEVRPLQDWRGLTSPILSALGAAGFFLAIVLVSRGKWMGVGDIKLAFLMGLILGWPNILVALFLAFSIGAIIGVGLIVLKKKGLKSEVPFGPFLITGTFLALFWGSAITDWYLNLILLK